MSTVTDEMILAAVRAFIRIPGLFPAMKAALKAAEAVRVKAESNLQKVQIPTSTLPEGFIPWHGGERPVAEGTECQLVFGDGFVTTPMPIHKRFFTKGFEPRTTVVAYRIHKPADFRLEAGKFYVTANGERVARSGSRMKKISSAGCDTQTGVMNGRLTEPAYMTRA